MHKFSSSDSFPKLRPIVYDLVRFLCDLLSHLVPSDYSCKDTFSFVSQIKNTNLSKKVPIPLEETIDIAINLIFDDNPNGSLTKKEL